MAIAIAANMRQNISLAKIALLAAYSYGYHEKRSEKQEKKRRKAAKKEGKREKKERKRGKTREKEKKAREKEKKNGEKGRKAGKRERKRRKQEKRRRKRGKKKSAPPCLPYKRQSGAPMVWWRKGSGPCSLLISTSWP